MIFHHPASDRQSPVSCVITSYSIHYTKLYDFDGNANALRLLSHQFKGRRDGGFALTYTTLSAFVKYPYESIGVTKPKFGFFQSEKKLYSGIAEELGLEQTGSDPLKFVRHPLVYLVEAADDICYQIMDIMFSENSRCSVSARSAFFSSEISRIVPTRPPMDPSVLKNGALKKRTSWRLPSA